VSLKMKGQSGATRGTVLREAKGRKRDQKGRRQGAKKDGWTSISGEGLRVFATSPNKGPRARGRKEKKAKKRTGGEKKHQRHTGQRRISGRGRGTSDQKGKGSARSASGSRQKVVGEHRVEDRRMYRVTERASSQRLGGILKTERKGRQLS